MISAFSAIRLLSIAVTGGVFLLMGNQLKWESFVYSIALSHYFLGLYYSRHRAVRLMTQPRSYLPLLLALLLGVYVITRQFSLLLYFGLHHVFNEVYMPNRTLPEKKNRELGSLRASSFFLHLFAYCFLLRHSHVIGLADLPLITAGLWTAGLLFAYSFWRLRPLLTPREQADQCLMEVLMAGLCAASFFYEFGLLQIVCFHFMFWLFYPALKSFQKESPAHAKKETIRYLLLTAGITIAAYLVSPAGWSAVSVGGKDFYKLFAFWSYIHITFSFFLSDAQPGWITRWFSPSGAAPASQVLLRTESK